MGSGYNAFTRAARAAAYAGAAALMAAASLASVGCAHKPSAMERSDLVLGTVCSVRIVDGGSEAALDAVFARLRDIESAMSANTAGTVIAEVNAAAGERAVKAPDDVRYVMKKALEYASLSRGAFDPTIGPIVKLWNIGMDGERVPSAGEIAAALPLVSAASVVVDDAAGTIYLGRKGMLADLGAIAKGYAADEAARILTERGVKAAVVDLGGNIKVVGAKPDGAKWRVGVQNPFDERGDRLGIASLEGGATIVTSGVYERFFIGPDGTRYHHILDTKTGYPVRNGLVSVTIFSSSSVDADGLSTTCFALGLEDGMALVETLPHVEALFIDEDRRVYMSSGVPAFFELEDASFTPTPLP